MAHPLSPGCYPIRLRLCCWFVVVVVVVAVVVETEFYWFFSEAIKQFCHFSSKKNPTKLAWQHIRFGRPRPCRFYRVLPSFFFPQDPISSVLPSCTGFCIVLFTCDVDRKVLAQDLPGFTGFCKWPFCKHFSFPHKGPLLSVYRVLLGFAKDPFQSSFPPLRSSC